MDLFKSTEGIKLEKQGRKECSQGSENNNKNRADLQWFCR